jgi:hypothetical protein
MLKLTAVRMGLCVLLAVGCSALAEAAAKPDVQHDMGSDHFAAGDSVRVTSPVGGDAILAGNQVEVLEEVGGDLLAAGQDIRIEKAVKDGVFAVGNRVSVDGSVARNVRAAGGTVEIGSGAKIDGNASLAGGRVRVLGPIDGYLQAAGGHVLLDAPVAGDVDVNGGDIELGPNARVGGKLRYTTGSELHRDASSQIQGGVERVDRKVLWPQWMRGRVGHRGGWGWSLGIVLLAAVLIGALPGLGRRLGDTVNSRWGWALLVGFIALVCIPALAVLLLITLVGIPLALILAAAYFLLLLLGYAATGVAVGDIALRRLAPSHTNDAGWRILSAALAMAAVSLLVRVPVLGGLVGLAALLIGIGALLLQMRRTPAPPAAPVV